jgi:hypothetical protein
MKISEWKDWCGDDVNFKPVWLGLGIWQAILNEFNGGTKQYRLKNDFFPRPVRDIRNFDALLSFGLIRLQATGDNRVRWNYPTSAILRSVRPERWRDIVLHFHKDYWRVVREYDLEPSYPNSWRTPLIGPGIPMIAASDRINVSAPQLRLGWPLRIGCFAQNKPAAALHPFFAPDSPTVARLTRAFALGRDHAKCDILVFWGTSEELFAHIVASSGRIKANLLILISPNISSPTTYGGLCDRARASGIIVVDERANDDELQHALLESFYAFTHGHKIDVALGLGLDANVSVNAMCLSEELATASLRDVARTLEFEFNALPDDTVVPSGPALDSGNVVRHLPPSAPSGIPPFELKENGHPIAFRKDSVIVNLNELIFDRESDGATVLAELSESINDATSSDHFIAKRAKRFLQQQSFVRTAGSRSLFDRAYYDDHRSRESATHGFLVGNLAEVDLVIGPEQEGWQSLPDSFDDGDLFKDRDSASLTVWLTEPDQLDAPVSAKISLPREGTSTPCTLSFTPRKVGAFEGRVTVLHHGRVLQTALLIAVVIKRKGILAKARPPYLQNVTRVRHNLGDVRDRRYFDLAIVENHTMAGAPRTVLLSQEKAWIADASALIGHLREINESLTEVAQSTADYADGIDGEAGRKILIDLARSGSALRDLLLGEHLERPGNNASMAQREFIQIVSMRSETVPLEFVYDFPTPSEHASLCEHWRQAVSAGKCDASCGGGSNRRVCPMGFWSVNKVIERHQLSYEHRADGKEYFIQSEPNRKSDAISVGGAVVFAGSSRLTDEALEKVRKALLSVPGVEAVLVRSWEQWADEVTARNPGLILSMPHTDGTNRYVSLEISRKTIKSLDLTEGHVCPKPDGRPPIVVLLGCDTADPTETFSRHVSAFNRKGAAVVLATMATVASSHAAEVAAMLATELLRKRECPYRIGEAIRVVKRQSLLNNLIMPLCIVAYGDADWMIETTGEKHDVV